MSFRELANRLRGLCVRQPAPTNEQARHEINAVIAQAIALYKDKADAGVTGFNPELVRIQLTKDSAKNQALLLTNTQGLPRWLDIIADLGKQRPGRVPVDPGAPRYKRQNRARGVEMATTSSPQYSEDGLDLVVKTYSPEDWPQRAPEYASVLELLAELAGEAVRAVDFAIKGNQPSPITSVPPSPSLPTEAMTAHHAAVPNDTQNQESQPAPKPKTGTKRRRTAPQRGLTDRQVEAMNVVAECMNNFAEAGRRMRLNPKTVRQHYDAGMAKTAAIQSGRGAPRTQAIPTDHRGQGLVDDARQLKTIRQKAKPLPIHKE